MKENQKSQTGKKLKFLSTRNQLIAQTLTLDNNLIMKRWNIHSFINLFISLSAANDFNYNLGLHVVVILLEKWKDSSTY